LFYSFNQLLLIDKKITEVSPLLTQAGYLVDNWQASQYQKEYLKVFFLVLQVMILILLNLSCTYFSTFVIILKVCHYLMAGQVKSVKPCLKQLQQSILTIMQPTWPSDEGYY